MKKTPYFDNIAEVKTVSPKTDKSCFFGYYDLMAYDESDSFHLCNISEFEDRLNTKNDALTLGVIDLENGNFEKIDDTYAWNFQQGAMLSWHRQKRDTVFYNIFRGGEYITVEKNVKTGKEKYSPVCANISRDGKYGLRINFTRIYDFRAGYGYCNTQDENRDIAQPKNDGVWLVDMKNGKEKFLYSYADLAEAAGFAKDDKLVVNHITFNLSGDKFIFLLRSFPKNAWDWGTSLIVSDRNGNFRALMKKSMYSHYDWRDDKTLLGYCRGDGIHYDMFTVDVDIGKWERLPNNAYENRDIHCLYSHDRSFFIGDDYPDKDGYRRIHHYDLKTNESKIILSTYSPQDISTIDIRTDPHNRYNRKGDKISFDAIHNGKREICEMDISSLLS